jgi:hypothetical protein
MKNNSLRFVMVGQTYARQSILKFLTFISNENQVNRKNIELHYFGNNFQFISDLCFQENISSDFIVDHGYIDASSLVEKIRNYDAAFLPYFGLEKLNVARQSFPSKFAVYVSAELPIFYVGYCQNRVSQIIISNQIGACFENFSEISSEDLEEFIRTVSESVFKDRVRLTYAKYFSKEIFLSKLSEIFNYEFKNLSRPDSLVGKYKVNDRLRYQDVRTHKYISNRLSSLVQRNSSVLTYSSNRNHVLQIVYKNSTEIEFKIFELNRFKFIFVRGFIYTEENKEEILMNLGKFFKTVNCTSVLVVGFEDLELYNLSSGDNLDNVLSLHRNSRKSVISKTPFYKFSDKNHLNFPRQLTIFDEFGLTFVIRALLSKLNFVSPVPDLIFILNNIKVDDNFRLNIVKGITKLSSIHYHDPFIGIDKKDFYDSKIFDTMNAAQKKSYLDFLLEYITTNVFEASYDINSTIKLLAFINIIGAEYDDFRDILSKPPLNYYFKEGLVLEISKEYFDSQNNLNALLHSKKLVFLNFLARLVK